MNKPLSEKVKKDNKAPYIWLEVEDVAEAVEKLKEYFRNKGNEFRDFSGLYADAIHKIDKIFGTTKDKEVLKSGNNHSPLSVQVGEVKPEDTDIKKQVKENG